MKSYSSHIKNDKKERKLTFFQVKFIFCQNVSCKRLSSYRRICSLELVMNEESKPWEVHSTQSAMTI